MANRAPELIDNLKQVNKQRARWASGELPRCFFIEAYPTKPATLEELLKEYDASEHNQDWDKHRQQTPPDPQDLIRDRQAIAFMVAGGMGVHREYADTELKAAVRGRHQVKRSSTLLKTTVDHINMKMYEKA